MVWLKSMLIAIGIIALGAGIMLAKVNDYQTNGEVDFNGLEDTVKVIRDRKGMAYIQATSLQDAIKAQGYVTAQDRLFQMHVTRLLIRGQLAEYFGEAAL